MRADALDAMKQAVPLRISATARLGEAIAIILVALAPTAALAQIPSDPFSYSRTIDYEYDEKGRLRATTVEPGTAGVPDTLRQCARASRQYDARGNARFSELENCTGAPTGVLFDKRSQDASFGDAAAILIIPRLADGSIGVSIPAGLTLRETTNPLGQKRAFEIDPRFGRQQSSSDLNGQVTRDLLDDFGRLSLRTYPDGTQLRLRHCVLSDAESDKGPNSVGCTTPTETPAAARAYVETQRLNNLGAAMAQWVRVFYDGLGREIRHSTLSLDGASQPAEYRNALVVSDTVFDDRGALAMQSQAYFPARLSSTLGGNGDVGVAAFEYDVLGRLTRELRTDATGSMLAYFGPYGSGSVARRSALTERVYDGLTETVTNDAGQTQTLERNAIRQVIRSTDAAGAQVAYRYDAFGNLETVRDAFDNRHTFQHTTLGWRVLARDPDRGTESYTYDAIGQRRSRDGPLQTAATTFQYDKLGRTVRRTAPEYESSWVFDSCANGKGSLCSSSTTHGVNKRWSYDPLGRPSGQRTDVLVGGTPGASFAWAWAYDSRTGRHADTTYPTGLVTRAVYTDMGFPAALQLVTALTPGAVPPGTPVSDTRVDPGTLLWKATQIDARRVLARTELANGLVTEAVIDPQQGRMTSTRTHGAQATVMHHDYTWDALGNLRTRIDRVGDNGQEVLETFEYGDNPDNTRNVNRLTAYDVSSPGIPNSVRRVELRYNALGMMLYRSDVGAYRYGAQGAGQTLPHAPRQIGAITFDHDLAGNVKTASGGKYRSLAYTSFHKPAANDSVLGQDAAGASVRYGWHYDENHQRILEVRSVGGGSNPASAGTRMQWSLNPDDAGGLGFERDVNSPASASAANPAVATNRHYLQAFGRTVAVVVSTGELPVLAPGAGQPPVQTTLAAVKLEYWLQDHLGSVAVTVDHAARVTARYAYDPYGQRRDAAGRHDAGQAIEADWGAASLGGTGRGYTGHEQLDDVGLVNMNGRLYDPRTGVFVQPDPMRGNPLVAQNYAAYAYVLNNPLNATDPTGFDRRWQIACIGTCPTTKLDGGNGSAPLPSEGASVPLNAWNKLTSFLGIGKVDNSALTGVDPPAPGVMQRIEVTGARWTEAAMATAAAGQLRFGAQAQEFGWRLQQAAQRLQAQQHRLTEAGRGLTRGAQQVLRAPAARLIGAAAAKPVVLFGVATVGITAPAVSAFTNPNNGSSQALADVFNIAAGADGAVDEGASGGADTAGTPPGGPDGDDGDESRRGVGGKGRRGDKNWRDAVDKVAKGDTHEAFGGKIASREEATALIRDARGRVDRIEGPHEAPNPHNYPHINYTTGSGVKGTIRITGL